MSAVTKENTMSAATTVAPVVLEPAAQEFADATANPPFLFDLGPVEGRKTVDQVQSGEIEKPDADIEDTIIQGSPSGQGSVRIVRPKGVTGVLPVILYTHGAGWVFGNAHTHDRLVREIAVGAHAAVVFVDYSRAPEARYPVAIEQAYAASFIRRRNFRGHRFKFRYHSACSPVNAAKRPQ